METYHIHHLRFTRLLNQFALSRFSLSTQLQIVFVCTSYSNQMGQSSKFQRRLTFQLPSKELFHELHVIPSTFILGPQFWIYMQSLCLLSLLQGNWFFMQPPWLSRWLVCTGRLQVLWIQASWCKFVNTEMCVLYLFIKACILHSCLGYSLWTENDICSVAKCPKDTWIL